MTKSAEGTLEVDGHSLSLDDVEEVARRNRPVQLGASAIGRIEAARDAVIRIAATGRPTYGVNTGLGALSTRAIDAGDARKLQHNLLRSHASGSGTLLPADVVRATMLIRANSLAVGHSGVRAEIVERLIELLNVGVIPAIPSQGSLGASGDLAPLAHLGLVLTGEGYVIDEAGKAVKAGPKLEAAGIEPIKLEAKEALALINGTATMAGLSSLALLDARCLLQSMLVVGALSAFAVGARREPFDDRLHEVRPHPGQRFTARVLRNLLGPLDEAARETARVQDPYSIRCIPQAIGAALDALEPLQAALAVEVNAATDNPLIMAGTDEALSGGNFHGHPLALPIEYAKIAVASAGTITERRVALLMDAGEYGLPAFLVANPGLNSGYMIAHYLTAGLVAENRVLAHPSAVDSIPTSANIEDYNSMGATGARHFADIVRNVERIVAVEALCAAQACDLRAMQPDGVLGEAYRLVRERVPVLEADDRIIADDIETVTGLVRSGGLAELLDEEFERR